MNAFQNGPPFPTEDKRHVLRRRDDLSVDEAINTFGKVQKVLVLGAFIGALVVGLLAWLGWSQRSPAQSIEELRGEVGSIRKEGYQRDTLTRSVAKSVALLTYYRCVDDNMKHPGTMQVDCPKLLQDHEP